MTIKNPLLIERRRTIALNRAQIDNFITAEIVKARTEESKDLELLADASGHLAEALLALDRVIGEPQL